MSPRVRLAIAVVLEACIALELVARCGAWGAWLAISYSYYSASWCLLAALVRRARRRRGLLDESDDDGPGFTDEPRS